MSDAHNVRAMTPSTSVSNPSSQETRGSYSPIHHQDIGQKQKQSVHNTDTISHSSNSIVNPQHPSNSGDPAWRSQAAKRTASGEVKQGSNSHPGSPGEATQHGHSRNTSTASKASQVSEISNELRTRLSYAMFKVQNGLQSNTIDQVEAIASQKASPSTGNLRSPFSQHKSPNPSTAQVGKSPRQPKALPHQVVLSPGSPSRGPQLSWSQKNVHQQPSRKQDLVTGGFEALSQGKPGSNASDHNGLHRRMSGGPSLAPPIDIFSKTGHRPHTANGGHPPRLETGMPYTQTNGLVASPVAASTGPSTPQRTPASILRTSSQKTSMEQDAVETLMFMSSPGNTGHFSAFHNGTSPLPSRAMNSSPKRVGFDSHGQHAKGSGLGKDISSRGSSYSGANGLGRLSTAAEIDRALDAMPADGY
ncbi:MAG: hypothetical protein Q9183_001263, partial [Haloplaca sp. 2 TL-2023]